MNMAHLINCVKALNTDVNYPLCTITDESLQIMHFNELNTLLKNTLIWTKKDGLKFETGGL